MNVRIGDGLAERIRTHAEQAYPGECCGFLLGKVGEDQQRIILGVESVTNEAADDADRYTISPWDYLRVDRTARVKGWDILGCYHSHPDTPPAPSAIDVADAWPWYLYLIVAVYDGQATDCAGWTLGDETRGGAQRFRKVDLGGVS